MSFTQVDLVSGTARNLNSNLLITCTFGLDRNNKFMINMVSDDYQKLKLWYKTRVNNHNTTNTYVCKNNIIDGKKYTIYYYSVTNEKIMPIICDGSREKLEIRFHL